VTGSDAPFDSHADAPLGSSDDAPFEPRVALASLSGRSDADWAAAGAPFVGGAFLGGIAVDEPTREGAREMVDRDRTEFLPSDPIAFVADQLQSLRDVPIRPGVNVRTTTHEPLARVASICADHDAILELNAHCRQDEICRVGAGQALLTDPERLCEQVRAAVEEGPTVSIKVRTEVPGVDLPSLAVQLETAGADIVHVDAMDSESVVADVVDATDAMVIANNGVRDRKTVFEYLRYGADAVSVGRPSDDPEVLSRVRAATTSWFGESEPRRTNPTPGENR
jgi:TIM-barrel protein